MEVIIEHNDGHTLPAEIFPIPSLNKEIRRDIGVSFAFNWNKNITSSCYEVYGMRVEHEGLIALLALRFENEAYNVEFIAKKGKSKTKVPTAPYYVTNAFLSFTAKKAYERDNNFPLFSIAPKKSNDKLWKYYEGILQEATDAILQVEAYQSLDKTTIPTYGEGMQWTKACDSGKDIRRSVIYVYTICIHGLLQL